MAPKRVNAFAAGAQSEGTVKSWNGSKGFGFITTAAFAGDLMFDRKELPEDVREVRGKFLEGQAVTFSMETGADGRGRATGLRIQAAGVDGESLAGAIKTYSVKNGYGFITSSSLSEDVRFSTADLPPTLMIGEQNAASLKGELVLFKTQVGQQDGKLRLTGGLRFQSNKIAEKLKAQYGGFAAPAFGGMGAGFGGMMQGAGFGGMTQGVVKSFSEQNGWGFISLPGMPFDVKFDRNTPGMQGQNLQKGSSVQVTMAQRPGGQMQATQISVGSKGAGKRPAPKALATPLAKKMKMTAGPGAAQPQPTGAWAEGLVKSFNELKGFGFITSASCPGDVFFMKTDVHDGAVMTGSHVSFQIMRMPDGKLRAQGVTVG